MPRVTRQTDFSGGELSPLLWGRTDMPMWARGVRTLRNFFVSKKGAAVSRPGTQYVVKTALGISGPFRTSVRLIPFVFDDRSGVVIEAGDRYFRFHQNGVPNVYAAITTPYAGPDLAELTFAQVGDVMTLCHRLYAPMELLRTTTGFTLSTVDFTLFDTRSVDIFSASQAQTLRPPALLNNNGQLFVNGAAFQKEWRYRVTALLREVATGRVSETRGYDVTTFIDATPTGTPPGIPNPSAEYAMPADYKIILSANTPVTIRRQLNGSFAPGTSYGPAYTVLQYNFYRGRGGNLFGYIGSTTGVDFVDVGEEPNYLLQPPTGKNPFANDYPRTVAYHDGRRFFGGSTVRPNTLWGSAVDNYADMADESLLPSAKMAVTYDLAMRKRETVRHIVSMRRLVVLTDAVVRGISGANSGPISAADDSPLQYMEDEVGAVGPQPLSIGGSLAYVRAKGRGARGLLSDVTGAQGLTPVDLSSHADHLFAGEDAFSRGVYGTRRIVDWCYAEDPWGLVWALRDDGVLLSLSVNHQAGLFGWAHHDTYSTLVIPSLYGGVTVLPQPTQGKYLAICSVPEADEDAVYVAVDRANGTTSGSGVFIERMSSRRSNGSADDFASLDLAKRVQVTPGTTVLTGLAHLSGFQVYVTAKGMGTFGPTTVDAATGTVTLPEGGVPANFVDTAGTAWGVAYVGLIFTPELELLSVQGLEQKTVTRVGFEVDNAVGLKVGQDFDHLTEWRQRNVADSYNGVSAATELVAINVRGTYDGHARAVLRQSQPLPVTVLGLTREIDSGG